MQRPPQDNLPATHIIEQAPEWMTPLTTHSRPRGSGMFGNGTNTQLLQVETSVRTQEVNRQVQQEFETKSQALPVNLEAEIAANRLQLPVSSISAVQASQREVDIRETLRARKTVELQQKNITANAFFGSDPRDKSFTDFVRKATTIDKLIWPGARSTQLWEQSYLAAHEAQLLSQSIALLHQQAMNAQSYLRAAQAEEHARNAAMAEAARVAAENARIAAEQQRQRDIADAARRQAEHNRAQEQARLAAVAEAQRLAAERARIAAEQQRQKELADAVRREQEQTQAREKARVAALAEAQRVAAERARIAAEQHRQKNIADAVRREQEQAQAREQTRLAALAERQRLADEQERLTVEALQRERELKLSDEKKRFEQQKKTEQIARRKRQQLARLKARADAEVRAEQARLKADWKKQTEARWQSPEFAHVGSAAVSGATFSGTLGDIAIDRATALALNSALRSGVASALAAAATFAAPAVAGFAALLVPSELGNGDLFSASVPLSNISSDLTGDLYELAAAGGRARIPVRLGTRTVGNRVDIVIVSTDGVTVPNDVPVRLADFDSEKNAYVVTAGSNGPTVTWTPLIEPIDPSSALPQVDRQLPVYDGATVKPADGRIDPFPELDLYGFGGYITIFPIESGIPPILTVFRDRRQDPGVASGLGQPVSGNWLGTASTSKGAPIPAQIADKLRGKEFSNFRAFRRAFWKAVGNDAALLDQFSRLNKIDLRDGLAPSALPSEQIGKRKKFEIHHLNPISEGGNVYDINNLTVLTPKQHIELHLKKGKL